jgi:DNA-binding GntR family transcriptional regulator
MAPENPVSLSEQAYQLIRDRILRGSLPLGAVLSRRRLAEEFGMSFLPVSEALQRLENEELVESRPRVGTRVRIPSPAEVLDRYVLREAVESQSARLCAERATFQERLELRRMAEQMDALFARCDSDNVERDFLYSVQTFHFQLHMRIAEYARSEVLRAAIEKNQVLVFNWLYDTAAERRRDLPASFHSDLADAICSGDVLRADRVMRDHIRYGVDAVVRAVKEIEANMDDQWRLRRPPKPYRPIQQPSTTSPEPLT